MAGYPGDRTYEPGRQAGRSDGTWEPIEIGNEVRPEGKPITPGSLRHSHKVWMIEDGIPEVAQFERFGHRLGGFRGVYSHVSAEMRQQILNGLQRRWEDSLRARFEISPHSPVPLLDKLMSPLREKEAAKGSGIQLAG